MQDRTTNTSDMNYEQKYNEALERAKKLYNSYNRLVLSTEEIEEIFPELAESEDERIRKELVEAFEALDIDSSWNGIPVKSILAWLKEQKPAEWSEEDKEMLRTVIYDLKRHDRDAYAAEIKWLECLDERLNLQPKQKWSEKDEKMLRTVISDGSRGVELDSKQITWLKSLRPQPKQEWSEEDERMIGRIRSVVNECASYNDALDVNGDYCEGDYAKLDAWLKSLPERKNLPPKQEWDKEDEIMLKWIEDILLIADGDLSDKLNGRVSPITDSAYSSMKLCIAKCLSWLKSLPLNLKKKNEDVAKLCSKEWSQEDEDRIRQIERIAQQAGCTQKLQEEIHDWLKSLRPSWKPSKHQMDILKAVKDYVGKGSGYWGEELGSLIEDLEKLM